MLSSALTSPGGSSKPIPNQFLPSGSLPPPLVLPTTSGKIIPGQVQARYTSPHQLQNPIPAISLVSGSGHTTSETTLNSTPGNAPRLPVSPVKSILCCCSTFLLYHSIIFNKSLGLTRWSKISLVMKCKEIAA